MSTLLYIGGPALLGFVLMALTLVAYAALGTKDWRIKASIWLALGQGALVALSVAFTYQRSISPQACLTAFFGGFGTVALAALDTLNLLWWLAREVRSAGTFWLPLPYLFVLLRLGTHTAFILSLRWCALLCTV
jgi:hypothetical protein